MRIDIGSNASLPQPHGRHHDSDVESLDVLLEALQMAETRVGSFWARCCDLQTTLNNAWAYRQLIQERRAQREQHHRENEHVLSSLNKDGWSSTSEFIADQIQRQRALDRSLETEPDDDMWINMAALQSNLDADWTECARQLEALGVDKAKYVRVEVHPAGLEMQEIARQRANAVADPELNAGGAGHPENSE